MCDQLAIAIQNLDVESVLELILKGAPVNVSVANRTPLFRALDNIHDSQKNRQIAHLLVYAGANTNEESGTDNETPLINAVKNDLNDIIDFLIQFGADVNHITARDETALIAAVVDGTDYQIAHLIQAGADVNIPIRETPLTCAILNGFERCADLLIQANPNLNYIPEYGKHSLLTACGYTAHPDVARLLLLRGAKVNLSRPIIDTVGDNFPDYDEDFDPEVYMLLFTAGEQLAYFDNTKLFLCDFVKTKRVWFLQQAVTPQMLTTDIRQHVLHLEQNHLYRKAYTEIEESGMTLMALCRHQIRKHLLSVGNENLFHRIPKLGLPVLLQRFLLFNILLDESGMTLKGLCRDQIRKHLSSMRNEHLLFSIRKLGLPEALQEFLLFEISSNKKKAPNKDPDGMMILAHRLDEEPTGEPLPDYPPSCFVQ